MDFTINSVDGCVHLTGEIDIYVVAALKGRFAPLIQAGQRVDVDLSGVTVLDSAGLQLLLMVRKLAGGLRIHAPSEVVRDVLEVCGLQELVATAPPRS